jgi:hypothetical protein
VEDTVLVVVNDPVDESDRDGVTLSELESDALLE